MQQSGVCAAQLKASVFKTEESTRSKKAGPGQGQSSHGIRTYLVCQHHRLMRSRAGPEGEG